MALAAGGVTVWQWGPGWRERAGLPADWWEPCDRCHKPRTVDTKNEVRRWCINRQCHVIVHRPCGSVQVSWGSIGCPCNEKIKLLPKLNRRSGRKWR